jgi:hypothetical protein
VVGPIWAGLPTFEASTSRPPACSSAAGWEPSAKSDALFGVIVESNFAVCDQNTPVGKIVPLEVSKRC